MVSGAGWRRPQKQHPSVRAKGPVDIAQPGKDPGEAETVKSLGVVPEEENEGEPDAE